MGLVPLGLFKSSVLQGQGIKSEAPKWGLVPMGLFKSIVLQGQGIKSEVPSWGWCPVADTHLTLPTKRIE